MDTTKPTKMDPANYFRDAESQHRFSRPTMLGNPDALFDLARHDAIVSSCMQTWRFGHCTLEQALITAVLLLSDQNRLLTKAVTDQLARSPARPPQPGAADPGDESASVTVVTAPR